MEMEKEISYSFFDSHAHYYDERFYGEENPAGAESLLDELFACGLLGAVNIGTNIESSKRAAEQALRYERMYAAVGIHPEDMSDSAIPLDEHIKMIRELAKEKKKNKIVAIGEIGLDYYWHSDNKREQIECFERQLLLARELDLPVIIHDREAHGDCFDTVCRAEGVRGVFHSYSGSAEMARELIKRGWYISFSGVVSFKNASKIKEVAAVVPSDRILIETDAPYLAPHPFRGKINHSGRLFYTAEALALCRGVSVEEISRLTYQNAKELFGV